MKEHGEAEARSPNLAFLFRSPFRYYNDPTNRDSVSGWLVSQRRSGNVDAEDYITVADRAKDMIKTGGENVAVREAEETINRLPAVSKVAVIGLPDSCWIEAITAFILVKTWRDCGSCD